MKIALIGPGLQPIPSEGWGACESIIWQYAIRLRKLGHTVDIINNPNPFKSGTEVHNGDYDFIHCMYDDHIAPIKHMTNKPFCSTTHYGYLTQYSKWNSGYKQIFDYSLFSPGLIVLSEEIKQIYLDQGYRSFIRVLRNGAEASEIKYNPNPDKEAICIGKIETRKRQSILSRQCEAGKVPIDFVGPITDNSFSTGEYSKYLGTWSRGQLYDNLTNYKCLVLLSDGEAAPLVIPEALCAGLSVVASEHSVANIPPESPGVYIIRDEDLGNDEYIATMIKKACNENKDYRQRIYNELRPYFDWDFIVKEYLQIIQEFKEYNQ